jgi:hypothetical protein
MVKCKKKPVWTEKELLTLKEFYPSASKKTIREQLPNRTEWGIYRQAIRLGLERDFSGVNNPKWKGDAASQHSARGRARRLYPVPKGFERHHIDGNPHNNQRNNIAILTGRQHMIADGRMSNRDSKGRFMGV